MECSPIVVGSDLNGRGSSIWIVGSTHKCESNLVLPLVCRSWDGRGIDVGMETMKEDGRGENESDESILISGVGLLMKNSHFVVGTGPLFWFDSDDVLLRGMSVETSLVSSNLVNVSSSSTFTPTKQTFGSEVSQLVVGSCVSCCTNHDSGTGMMSPNMGGNVVCLNTSFSSCIRDRNEDLHFSFENRTQTSDPSRFVLVSSDVTSVSFTLCTFSEMSVESSSGSLVGGAAILLCYTSSSLTVNTCFFHTCSSMRRYGEDGGGAIGFASFASNAHPFSVSDSSFTECSSIGAGGSVSFLFPSSISIDSCFFEQSTAMYGGALSIYSDSMVSISNCAFVECSAEMGGGIAFSKLPALSVSFVQFRECSSTDFNQHGNDIYWWGNGVTVEITSDMFENCDSTSAIPNVYFEDIDTFDSTLVPQVTSPTIKSVDVSFDGSVATVTVETEEAIKGTMGVLLDGSNVPRLVYVVFGEPTKESRIGTAVVSSGANGILPDDTTYTNRTTSFATNFFPLPTIWTAASTLKAWNTTEIVLRGVSLSEGSYWMLVGKEETEWNITLIRSDSTTLTGTASLSSSNSEVTLEWSTEYEVQRVVWMDLDGQAEDDVRLPHPITFTTPADTIPPFSTLTDVSAHIWKSDQRFAFLLLVFDRVVSGSYDFVVEERGKDVTFTVVMESAGTTSETEEFVVVGDERVLTDDTTYTIKSIVATPGSSSTPVVMSDTISFHIPESSFVPPTEPEDPEPNPDGKKALSKEMKTLLSWLIPLVVCLLIALLLAIVIIVLLRRRKNIAETSLKEMEEQEPVELEKVEEVGGDCSNGVGLGSDLKKSRRRSADRSRRRSESLHADLISFVDTTLYRTD
ncbi:hypothetical protein BLNAU_9344 [Blattamonas nauphoetae]|uniref:Right handed beta helix domain-containing protein n=1 Tax=Blattamonas nauphoetae TaxID=2049346 RepID=A0ABQ9XVZ6_9EUKA|nr:hypothetical protein BLNAU_9344 [Blattamonas nauphoetae]